MRRGMLSAHRRALDVHPVAGRERVVGGGLAKEPPGAGVVGDRRRADQALRFAWGVAADRRGRTLMVLQRLRRQQRVGEHGGCDAPIGGVLACREMPGVVTALARQGDGAVLAALNERVESWAWSSWSGRRRPQRGDRAGRSWRSFGIAAQRPTVRCSPASARPGCARSNRRSTWAATIASRLSTQPSPPRARWLPSGAPPSMPASGCRASSAWVMINGSAVSWADDVGTTWISTTWFSGTRRAASAGRTAVVAWTDVEHVVHLTRITPAGWVEPATDTRHRWTVGRPGRHRIAGTILVSWGTIPTRDPADGQLVAAVQRSGRRLGVPQPVGRRGHNPPEPPSTPQAPGRGFDCLRQRRINDHDATSSRSRDASLALGRSSRQ